MDPYGDGGRLRRFWLDVDPSSFRSSTDREENSKRRQDDGASKSPLMKERHGGKQKANASHRKKKDDTESRSQGKDKPPRPDRPPSRNPPTEDHRSLEARKLAEYRAAAEAAASHVPVYKDIIAAIDDLDDVVRWYEAAARSSEGEQSWVKYGNRLFENILDALDFLDRLTPTMPAPTTNKRDIEVAEVLKPALDALNPGLLLDVLSQVYFGREEDFIRDVSKTLHDWRQKGKKRMKQPLRALEELEQRMNTKKYAHYRRK